MGKEVPANNIKAKIRHPFTAQSPPPNRQDLGKKSDHCRQLVTSSNQHRPPVHGSVHGKPATFLPPKRTKYQTKVNTSTPQGETSKRRDLAGAKRPRLADGNRFSPSTTEGERNQSLPPPRIQQPKRKSRYPRATPAACHNRSHCFPMAIRRTNSSSPFPVPCPPRPAGNLLLRGVLRNFPPVLLFVVANLRLSPFCLLLCAVGKVIDEVLLLLEVVIVGPQVPPEVFFRSVEACIPRRDHDNRRFIDSKERGWGISFIRMSRELIAQGTEEGKRTACASTLAASHPG